jgi:hypothetical protein
LPKNLVIETNFANPSLKKLVNINMREKRSFGLYQRPYSTFRLYITGKERGIDLLMAGHLRAMMSW